ncbi:MULTISPECIES: response regulator [unclassified Sulfitobacter]|jgi:DNA-directed RNA polymerase specialized sigma24 family protein/CheY-like chemotaxis protein|uniref:response regulator n=1 Tax=unclassified Sulfitobacter TaxID=196795 RepID=UPI0007C2EC7E|nr:MULTISPECIES: response regulator [unclassified Sulfitobacter]KZX99999.1 two-component response regulator [Sulfitobacter sp. HI0023]KZY22372.1 two-component response regulator [Sulfitobacter sp. HI0040]KZZ64303.1 two-component response regulator [Sulfitobacter sp. HI0129]
MTDTPQTRSISDELGDNIPYLRRFARAMTGSQKSGDMFAAAALEAILVDRSVLDGMDTKTGLFKVLYGIWASAGAPVEEGENGLQAKAQRHLAKLTTDSREALLLHTIEGFNFREVASIVGVEESEAEQLVDIARREMADSATGSVMIIEDEAIIAMDIESIVADMGHRITGVARTRDEAVKLGRADVPDLILADIQLADNSSGIDAVNDLLGELGMRPVIFITAFPERLLTGDKPEPAFLISKPYSVDQVVSAVSQAMFFSSTETLNA